VLRVRKGSGLTYPLKRLKMGYILRAKGLRKEGRKARKEGRKTRKE
jgi:hypothetical protein